MLSLEEQRGDGAQRDRAAWHAAELIIVVMARPPGRWRLPWLLGVLALVVPLAYILYPVRSVVSLRQDIDRGTPLFEYIPDGQWAAQAYGSMSRPGVPPEPEWYRAGKQRHVARAGALRRWTTRVYSPAARALGWERLLQRRLNVRIDREDQLAMEEAQAAENVQRERLSTDPDRDSRLEPLGKVGRVLEPPLGIEQEAEALRVLLAHADAREVQAERLGLDVVPAGADAAVDAPAGEMIDRPQRLGVKAGVATAGAAKVEIAS
jgi:hypothetical protein